MSTKEPTDGRYVIESVLLGGQVLEVEGEKANDGTRVDLWQNTGKPHQRWQLIRMAGTGAEACYMIGHPDSPMVMEAPGPWAQGDSVVMRDQRLNGDDTHRQWRLVPVPGRTDVYKIVNHRSNMVIDVEGGLSGTRQIKLYTSWSAPDDRQHWNFVRI